MTTIISTEELKRLIEGQKPTKPKKKVERNEEQTKAMLDKLARMRATCASNRAKKLEEKKASAPTPAPLSTPVADIIPVEPKPPRAKPVKEKFEPTILAVEERPVDNVALFEKRYNNKLEKLDEDISEVKSAISSIATLKREKAEERKRAKEEKDRMTKEAEEAKAKVVPVVPVVPISEGVIPVKKLPSYSAFRR